MMKKSRKATTNKQRTGIMRAKRVVKIEPIISPVETRTLPMPPVVAEEAPLSMTVPA